MQDSGRLGVVLANTGTPSAPTPEAVGEYLQEFLTDPRICPMNPKLWSLILRAFILPKRSVASAQKYEMIWTEAGSPLARNMESLADKLEHALQEMSKDSSAPSADPKVVCAMSYGSPSMRDALGALRESACDEIVVVPMYPQSAYSTTSVVMDKLDQTLEDMDWKPIVHVVESYHDEPMYLDAIARSIENAGFSPSDTLLLAFHSIPMTDIENGDAYAGQVRDSVSGIAKRLGASDEQCKVAFQCRFDKSRKWLSPYAKDVLEQLDGSKGRLFVATPNFSMDCLETLYDVEVELRKAAPFEGDAFRYVPCLNDSDAQVRLLCELVRKHAELPAHARAAF